MRFSPSIMCLAIAAGGLFPSTLFADEISDYAARANARRDLELARMELRYYWQVEYPRKRRHLNAEIELTEAEVRDYKERLREYYPFDRFSIGRPFMVTLQDLRMCLREAELRLRDLWAERNALVRFHSDHWRALEIRVYEARLRVADLEAELEAEDAPIVEPAADGQPI